MLKKDKKKTKPARKKIPKRSSCRREAVSPSSIPPKDTKKKLSKEKLKPGYSAVHLKSRSRPKPRGGKGIFQFAEGGQRRVPAIKFAWWSAVVNGRVNRGGEGRRRRSGAEI